MKSNTFKDSGYKSTTNTVNKINNLTFVRE